MLITSYLAWGVAAGISIRRRLSPAQISPAQISQTRRILGALYPKPRALMKIPTLRKSRRVGQFDSQALLLNVEVDGDSVCNGR
jgi:hypothetical protein